MPLRNVEVKSRRWFTLGQARTDGNGRFSIGQGYRREAKVFVEFKTERATTRGITFGTLARPWELVLPIRHQLGSYTGSQMQGLRYHFSYQADATTKGALSWTAATLFNTVDDMYAYCAASGIPTPPANLNIMLFSRLTSSAATPMLRYLTETSLVSQMISQTLTPAGQVLKAVVQRQLPDITCRYEGNGEALLTDELDETFFHELGHSVHYRQAGNLYWTGYITLIVEAAAKRLLDNSRTSIYGRKTDNGAGLIAVSEAWGNYVGNTFAARKYDAINLNIARFNRDRLEFQTPNDDPDDDDRWIVYGMFHDMTDNTTEPPATGVTDNVNSYTTIQLYRAMQPDVMGVRKYQQRVLSQNNNRQASEMEQLVTSYRW
ncbi:hypothetical protein [Hymenobacter rubripertinctus]|uniref:Uncharacterized protein n=1 Tax=Hymenobacter rubripertinctus TaxID=2029981 RepID=A0A418QR79_9BACT|nr:hypothetical protein [Hymenobacter rubripertinctus]RIY07623.1 hypothetical protein D0T11_16215 [Hymenobacter rubripertinctus]